MATTFIDTYFTDYQYFPTSAISSVKAETDKPCIDVALSCENGVDGDIETFFATTLYAFDGVVELCDVGAIIEEYFRKRKKVADTVSIVFDSVSADAHCLYCEYSLPDAFNPADTFFLSSMTQKVLQDSLVAIAAANRGAAVPFILKIAGHSAVDGEIAIIEKEVNRPLNSEHTAYFNVSEIIGWAMAQQDGTELVDVMYFSIAYGNIQKMFYILPASAHITFSFRNIFNVMEYIDVVGVMTTKSLSSRNIALCEGRSRLYDRTVSRTYEVATEPLSMHEVHIFEQFLCSHDIKMNLEGNEWDILISEHTCEPDSDDENLTVVKFSWQFADKRPRLFDSEFDGIIPARHKIFNFNFSPEYD